MMLKTMRRAELPELNAVEVDQVSGGYVVQTLWTLTQNGALHLAVPVLTLLSKVLGPLRP